MDGYKGGRNDYFADGGNSSNDQENGSSSFLPPLPSSSMSNDDSNNGSNNSTDFSPHFLVAAAAASAQAEAARTGMRLPPSSSSTSSSSSMLQASSSMSPAPPLPYLEYTSPFPMNLGNRFINPNDKLYDSSNGKTHGPSNDLGRVRCCWAILSTMSERLDFLYVDPMFGKHLSSQSSDILGTSFFDYIHPEEEERTRIDMKNIIGSRTLFGSVTRCRYSRLPRIRSILQKVVMTEKDSEDSYLPIDIVVNWIGEDMALCFFHAILDESTQDNDEMNKTDWSNWCGMKADSFDQHECQPIWQSIQSHRSLTSSTTGPKYVFQVLSTVPSTSTPQVLFSWPPPRLFASPTNDALTASGINFADGSYFVDDFARLAQGVDQLILKKELSDANTSCTRRFRAKHTLTTEGMIRSVESVLIPYGSIVLACFSVIYAQMLPGSAAAVAADFTASAAKSNNGSSSYPKLDQGQITESFKYNKTGSSMPASIHSLVDASISLSKGEGYDQSIQGSNLKAKQQGDDAGRSVATLAAVAAAAAAQSKTCATCGTSNSPEWRKGPDGTKSLCNACGLRYSRTISRTKKKEERALIAAEVAANGGVIPPHLRRKLDDDSRKKNKKIKTGKKDLSNQKEAKASTSIELALQSSADNDTDGSKSGETANDQDSIQVARAAAADATVTGVEQEE